jgi:hypothetical protein
MDVAVVYHVQKHRRSKVEHFSRLERSAAFVKRRIRGFKDV